VESSISFVFLENINNLVVAALCLQWRRSCALEPGFHVRFLRTRIELLHQLRQSRGRIGEAKKGQDVVDEAYAQSEVKER